MKIEATAKDIRALQELSELDRGADQAGAKARRQDREAAARRVPRPLLARYELLLEAGRTPVVAAIERGACAACHVRLPTMVEYRARRSAAVHTCPHCRRMLYAPELLREEPGLSRVKTQPAAGASAPRRS
ncbi:MAG TPA: C4-type zinc ribbon domain-containing protein [Vicinamibacteria bacterium]|nr:C4-type zinc ribbon domain-containing protein [Vicinamibacteria bacterium]